MCLSYIIKWVHTPRGRSVAEWLVVLDSGEEGPAAVKSQLRRCPATVLGKLFQLCLCPPSSEIGSRLAVLLRVARVTAGLGESNDSRPPGLWLTSPAGWLPGTVINSGTLRSAIEYGLPFPFYTLEDRCQQICDANATIALMSSMQESKA